MSEEICKVCHREILAGTFQVNSCRAFAALEYVQANPGLTSWELSKKMGKPYADIMEGLNKARGEQWVQAVSEEREQGGIRYRYYPLESSLLDMAMANHLASVERMASTFVRH